MTFIRDLILPDTANDDGTVTVVEHLTGNTVRRPPRVGDMTWDELSGPGIHNPYAGSTQPFVGCLTRGDVVAAKLMEHLCD